MSVVMGVKDLFKYIYLSVWLSFKFIKIEYGLMFLMKMEKLIPSDMRAITFDNN